MQNLLQGGQGDCASNQSGKNALMSLTQHAQQENRQVIKKAQKLSAVLIHVL